MKCAWKGKFRNTTEIYDENKFTEIRKGYAPRNPSEINLKKFLGWATNMEINKIKTGYKINGITYIPTLEKQQKILNAFIKASGYKTNDGLKNLIFRFFCFDRFFDVERDGVFYSKPWKNAKLSDLDFYSKNFRTWDLLAFYNFKTFSKLHTNNKTEKNRLYYDINQSILEAVKNLRIGMNRYCGCRIYLQEGITPVQQFIPKYDFDVIQLEHIKNTNVQVLTLVLTNPHIIEKQLLAHPLLENKNNSQKIIENLTERCVIENERHIKTLKNMGIQVSNLNEIISYLKLTKKQLIT